MIANGDHDNVSVLLNTSKPALTVTPSSLAFGSQTLHTTGPPLDSRRQHRLRQLRIDNVAVRGTAANRFAITGENCTGDSLLVGEGCAVSVSFTPNQQGSVSATLRITDNAPGSPHDVALSGTGGVPACAGADATIVGTAGADTLVGTPGNDVAALLGGDDTFRGGNGNDTVCGGNGDDDLNGQVGLDSVRAGNGDDQLRGENNNDNLFGGSDDDDLFGGASGGDLCNGGSGSDTADADCETLAGIP